MDFPAQLDQAAITAALAFRPLLPRLPSGAYLQRIYDHWSVEEYGCVDASYNAVVALIGGAWKIVLAHDPIPNAYDDPDHEASHTYHRNGHAFGIALNGMVGATPGDFGEEPVQRHELETLCAANAVVAIAYGIDLSALINEEHPLATHAEAAILDRYYPGDGDPEPRWDLATFEPTPDGEMPSKAEAIRHGDLLRARSREYKLALMGLIRPL